MKRGKSQWTSQNLTQHLFFYKIMQTFNNVTVDSIANLYFDGKVVSHTVHLPDGSRKTLGIIFPGTYRFETAAPELMEITSGSCDVAIDGSNTTRFVPTDESFEISGDSGFSLTVNEGVCQYVCSYLKS